MKITKMISFVLLAVSLVFLAGCIFQTTSEIDVNEIKNEGECRNHPDAVWFDGRCWYDMNHDGLADDLIKEDCDEFCNIDEVYCKEEGQRVWYECKPINDCFELERVGITIGKCGIECILEEDCYSDERCFNYKCEKDRCGDGSQGTYENCENCPADFLKEGLYCCNKEVVAGDCCSDEDCEEEQTCEKNLCKAIPVCGDSICQTEIGENCGTCSQDCQIPDGQVCCSEALVEGNCCSNDQCEVNQICLENTCTVVEQPITNETESNQTGGNNTE